MFLKQLTLLLLLLLLIACGGGGDSQARNEGSGSEIVGVVQTDEDQRMARAYSGVDTALIFLLDIEYSANGTESPITLTESDGSFGIASAAPGRYLLEAYDQATKQNKVALVNVSGDGNQIDLGYLTIEEAATLNCSVKTNIPVAMDYKISVLGTRVFAMGDEKNLNVTLESVPTGYTHTVRLEVTNPISYSEDIFINFAPGTIIDTTFDLSF